MWDGHEQAAKVAVLTATQQFDMSDKHKFCSVSIF